MQRWHLRDWDLRRFKLFLGVRDLRETELGYLLTLDYSMGYRRFLIHDNGGEVNIEEIGRSNAQFVDSLELPIHGSYAQTNESVVHYRLMQRIQNLPIDWEYEDATLTEEDYRFLVPA